MRVFDYVQQGGVIMYILVFLNIVGVSILIWKMLSFIGLRKKLGVVGNQLLGDFRKKVGNSKMPEALRHELLKEEIGNYVSSLEVGLNTVKIIASIAPLLGLLGTVIGILSAFEIISQKGLSDPSFFAGGISLALITTVGGLIVAIPHYIGHNYLTGALDNLESALEREVLPKAFD